MPFVRLATCAELPNGDEDAAAVTAALGAYGVRAEWSVWTDSHVRWDESMVVIRSTWDYTTQREHFLAWTDGLAVVANPADMLRWNTDKRYLLDLVAAGLPVVPTRVGEPGALDVPDGPFVLKPSVGAGSRGVGRFAGPDDADAAQRHADDLHAEGRTVLLQPYLDQVDTAGETALIYLDGRYSHAIRKAAMLAVGASYELSMQHLYVEERIEPRAPSAVERGVGEEVLAAVRQRFGADPLYARVDLLPTPDGPVVVELELTEPSLFLAYGVGAAHRLAAAIAARVGSA